MRSQGHFMMNCSATGASCAVGGLGDAQESWCI
jgi:hypothetical protein